MGIKFILLLLAIIAAVTIIRFLLRNRAIETRKTRRTEAMNRCAHCGLHIPASEALHRDGYSYCSRQHQIAGPRDRNDR